MSDWRDDDALLDDLRAALDPVPASFLEAGRAVFAWRTIDADLASVAYDSAGGPASDATAESAALRSLVFETTGQSVSLEIGSDLVRGHVAPAASGEVELRFADGEVAALVADGGGDFVVSPVPHGRFRLYCAPAGRPAFLTDWIALP